jgi:hypothetical protein
VPHSIPKLAALYLRYFAAEDEIFGGDPDFLTSLLKPNFSNRSASKKRAGRRI